LNNKFQCKNHTKSQKLQIIVSSRINSGGRINSALKYPNI
jgi:hypothetical protein